MQSVVGKPSVVLQSLVALVRAIDFACQVY